MPSGHCWQNQTFKKNWCLATGAKVCQKRGVVADPKADVFMHKMKKIYERRVYFCKLIEEEKLTEKL